ncbi:MAG: tRNA pseudouridine(55) synthase TruB [Patescibacteria group bacterium UBA2163]
MDADIVLVDKPKGITSFDVIRRLRRELNIKKMGHAGTLDPQASGLMIIGIERGTKKLEAYLKLPKTYLARIVVGERRDTGDLEGEIVEEVKVSHLEADAVEEVLHDMVGTLELPVPVYSAIKRDGQALYKRARRGEDVVPPVKAMIVRAATLENITQQGNRMHVTVTFDVASGTYIRSLAEEFGRRLGYPATLGDLRRTSIGDFSVEDARSI